MPLGTPGIVPRVSCNQPGKEFKLRTAATLLSVLEPAARRLLDRLVRRTCSTSLATTGMRSLTCSARTRSGRMAI